MMQMENPATADRGASGSNVHAPKLNAPEGSQATSTTQACGGASYRRAARLRARPHRWRGRAMKRRKPHQRPVVAAPDRDAREPGISGAELVGASRHLPYRDRARPSRRQRQRQNPGHLSGLHCIRASTPRQWLRRLREAEALGFIRIAAHGRGGNAEYRQPSKYRLTFALAKRMTA